MKMTNIAAKIPPAIAAMRLKSENGCLTSEDMPMTVAIAPGPNMMGMARGTKATFLSRRVESFPPVGITSFEEEGQKKNEADTQQDYTTDDADHTEGNFENFQHRCSKYEGKRKTEG